MKQEQLLQAIGGVSEDMLMETEGKTRHFGKTFRRIVLVAAVMSALTVTALACTGTLSRLIGEVGIVTGETVAPFEMDAEGNIIMGGVKGQKVTMQVEIDPNAPAYLEELYYLELPGKWQDDGGASAGGVYTYFYWERCWEVEGKPGQLRLHQSTTSNYTEGVSGENVVDMLQRLPADVTLTTQKVTMAGMEMLKLTIPELPGYDESQGHLYCAGGETRLYWSDGRYLLQLDYPYWVTDAEAEKLLQTLYVEEFVVAFPEDYGRVNTERLMQLHPPFAVDKDSTGTTMANSVMGLGKFAYSEGKIYYGQNGRIYSYDLDTGETKTLLLPSAYNDAYNLFATEYYICYSDLRDGLWALPKDGGEPVPVYQGLGTTALYADGPMLYTTNGASFLSRINLLTGKEEKLVEDVISYFVDDTYIYAVQSSDNGKYFLRSEKEEIHFEKITLSFAPIKVFADGEDLYFCEGGLEYSYQVIHYRDGMETRLPMCSYNYQILDGKLIYEEDADKFRTVKSYNLKTGEIQVLQERVQSFSILEDRYINFFCVNDEVKACWRILDWQTGEYVQPEVKD